MRTKTIGYVRVSTEDQASNGVSLDAQRAKLEAYAVACDLDLIEVIADPGWSGKTLDRPGLRRALAMLAKGEADALLVTKLDRLTRSVRDLGELLDGALHDAELLSVGDSIDTRSPGGRLVLNILASVAQWEREAIAQRVRDAMQHIKAQGRRVGGIPFGFAVTADGTTLLPEPGEQAVIAQVVELREAGASLRVIAAALAERGHTTRTGKKFLASQIDRMIKPAKRNKRKRRTANGDGRSPTARRTGTASVQAGDGPRPNSDGLRPNARRTPDEPVTDSDRTATDIDGLGAVA
jgi:site-specific DNA recombinase